MKSNIVTSSLAACSVFIKLWCFGARIDLTLHVVWDPKLPFILNICCETAAAAKSLQSCPTLCDPIDGSQPGSPVRGILQARTLEWVAIIVDELEVRIQPLEWWDDLLKRTWFVSGNQGINLHLRCTFVTLLQSLQILVLFVIK